MGRLTLILGGARSGKSDYGERMAASLAAEVLFIATAQPFDEEMAERIRRHRQSRPVGWRTVEAPKGLALALEDVELPPVGLVDCMTMLVSNLMMQAETGQAQGQVGEQPNEQPDAAHVDGLVRDEIATVLALVGESDSHWLLISNEVGLGIVPDNRLARLYRDVLGRANQQLAAAADEVLLMVAGLPLTVKG